MICFLILIDSLGENERKLASIIEQKMLNLANSRIELVEARHKNELNLRLFSLKQVMSSIGSASVKYLTVETCERINRIQNELNEFKQGLQNKSEEVLAYQAQMQV